MAAKRIVRPPDSNPPTPGTSTSSPNVRPPELIVVAAPDTSLRARAKPLAMTAGAADVGKLSFDGVVLEPLFGAHEARVRSATASREVVPSTIVPDLSRYYRVDNADSQTEEGIEALAERLREYPEVEAAYIKPTTEPAVVFLNDMPPSPQEAPAVTPDFSARQGYLTQAPVGVDAPFAWTIPGGRGAGVNIIDVEWGWRFNHEDLRQVQGGVLSGANSADDNHGTAVLGEFSGDVNAFGITGIAPEARASSVSLVTHTTSQAIRMAADRLQAGDIILLEVHRAGPAANGQGQFGFIGIEWWPDDFDAIRYAVTKGIIVVEAAGNGGQNLDAPIYNTPQAGFPPNWRNPFNPANPSSGAVLVGAGNPPAGTHGRNAEQGWGEIYADRARCFFSNYGARIDAQGWGWEVTSTGYGDLQGGSDRDFWYTDVFSGTSSASPIVVGVLASLQGVFRARGAALLTSDGARQLLRATGSPQQAGPGFTFLGNMTGSGYPQNHPPRPVTERIGNRPNLRQLITQLTPVTTTRLFRYWNAAGADHFYTTDWNELGTGAHGWVFERVECDVHAQQQPGTVPLYRYWNASGADHFYTTDWSELGNGAHGWVFERVQCYVYPQTGSGLLPLYRYWNASGADHFYTTDWNELGNGAHGWQFEHIQCYVLPRSAGPTPDAGPERPSTFTITGSAAAAGRAPAPSFQIAHAPEAGASTVPSTFQYGPSPTRERRGDQPAVPDSFSIATETHGTGDVTVTVKLQR